MRVHVWTKMTSFTAVAALVAGVTTAAHAQARATSQQRIPVQKESAGDVARRDSIARADSIAAAEAARRDSVARAAAAARQDSITKADMARRDSIARAEAARADSIARAEAARRDSIARADSIRNAAAAAQAAFMRKGFFFGLAGGYSSPSSDYGDAFKPGYNITLPFGWQRRSSRWGIRGDIAYDSHDGKTFTAAEVPPVVSDPAPSPGGTANYDTNTGSIWSGNLDGVVDLAQWGANRNGSFYLLGGGGIHFLNKKTVNVTPTSGANAGVTTSYENDSQTKFGLNGGAGVAFPVGRAALYLESRYFSAFTNKTNSDWIPIILGVKWR